MRRLLAVLATIALLAGATSLAERRAAGLPPYAYQALLRAEARRLEDAAQLRLAVLRPVDERLPGGRHERLQLRLRRLAELGSGFADEVLPELARVLVLRALFDRGQIDEATGLPEGSVGAFLEASLDFVIVGFVMFLVVKAYNRAQAAFEEEEEEAAPEEPSEDIVLLREIRDSLNK